MTSNGEMSDTRGAMRRGTSDSFGKGAARAAGLRGGGADYTKRIARDRGAGRDEGPAL